MVLPAENCDPKISDCTGTTDEWLQGREAVDVWKTVIVGLWAWFNSLFFWTLYLKNGFKVKMTVGTTQKLYDFSLSFLLILHLVVWGVEAFMWPFTYFKWPKFNKVYILLWNWVGQWGGLTVIGVIFILLAVVLSQAEVDSVTSGWIHMDYNSTPDTDTVVKQDVRYMIAMYLTVEAMYLTNWFMYGKDAMKYYKPAKEEDKFSYVLAPQEE